MQAGDLVKDRHGNFGVIVKQHMVTKAPKSSVLRSKPRTKHVWVLWGCGSETIIHKGQLYKIT